MRHRIPRSPAWRLAALAPLALTVVVAGCGDGGDSSATAAADADPVTAYPVADYASDFKPVKGGTIQYGHYQEPPCLVTTWVQTGYLTRQYLEQLITVDKDGKFLPWLADSWEISDDKKTYTFHLKPGVKFSNGEAFDSAAVKANFDNWLSTDPTRRNGYVAFHVADHLDEIETPDPETVVFELKHPHQPFLSVLSQYAFGFLSPNTVKAGPETWCEKPVGTGPFVVEQWNRGQNVILRRNENYTSAPGDAKNKGPAYVDGINWKFLKDNTSRWGSLKSGQSDLIYDIPAVNWKEATASPQYTVLRHITGGRPSQLGLATDHAPFDDVKVRQAFAYSLDNQKAVETTFLGAVPYNGNGSLSASSPEWRKDLENAFPYDPAKANALLDEAGWTEKDENGVRSKGGKPLTVRIVYGAGSIISSDGAQYLQVVQDQAKQVGFDVQLKPVTTAEFFAGKGRQPGEYEIQPGYWVARTAEIFQVVWKPDATGPDGKKVPNANNTPRFQNPEVWKLIRQADAEYDDAKRTALYEQIQELLVKKYTATIGAYPLTVSLAISDKLTGVRLNPSIGEPVFNDAYFVKR